MRGIRIRRMALVVGGASVVMLATAAVATAQVSGNGASSRHVLAGSKPSWTAAVSASAAQGAIRAKVWLAPRNAAQLDALAVAVATLTVLRAGSSSPSPPTGRSSRRPPARWRE